MKMIKAKYPIIGTDDFLTVEITQPEPDPISQFNDQRCRWTVSAPNFEKSDCNYGVDELQCVYLSFKKIRNCIAEFEKTTNQKCEYSFWAGEEFFE